VKVYATALSMQTIKDVAKRPLNGSSYYDSFKDCEKPAPKALKFMVAWT